MRANRLLSVALVAATAAALAACGQNVDNGVAGDQPSQTDYLRIYVSMPRKGPDASQSEAMIRGMKLRFAEQKGLVGGKRLQLKVHDDTGADGHWDDGAVTDNAREAVRDPTAIAYIGEMDSGASALSIPILDEAGVLQVSPSSGYVGLTRNDGIVTGEPAKYYPAAVRNFGRVTPGDHVQALAQTDIQKRAGCTAVHFLHDEELYGLGLARVIEATDQKAGLKVTGEDTFDPTSTDFSSVVKSVEDRNADCVFVGTADPVGASRVFRALHRADPTLRLFGPDRLVSPAFTSRIGGAATVTALTSPRLRRSDYPASAREVLRRFDQEYGGGSTVDVLYGYATMDAVIESILNAKGSGSRQLRTIRAFFSLERDSVLGKYKIGDNGDSSLAQYGSYTVAKGKPRFAAVINTK